MDSTATDRALSEVVGFVMILGVIVVGLSIYQVYFVPAEGREDEIVHMGVVNERFTDYKVSLDSLWINNWTGSTLSTSFDLGTGGSNTQNAGWSINLFAPVYSTGTVKVNQRNENMTINWTQSGSIYDGYKFTMGEVEYISGNNYWIQQSHYYQMGGVFLTQENENGSTVRISPPLSIYQVKRNETALPTAKIVLTAIQIEEGNQIISGGGPVRIDTRLKEGIVRDSYYDLKKITLAVNATDEQTARMWERIFYETVQKSQMPSTWYSINSTGTSTTLDIWGNTSSTGVDLDLTRVRYGVSVQSLARGF
jgi:hypothetical protein